MTGLDKIIKHIEGDASATAEELILQAKEIAEQMRKVAKADGERLTAESKEQTSLEVDSYTERAKSAAALQKRKMILTAKQECISEIIEKTQDHLLHMESEEYFTIIMKMIPKYVRSMNGQIMFSSRDLERMPTDLQSKIEMSLADREGAMLQISDKPAKIKGGFVLIYEDVEENCSFEALFENDRDQLQDKIGALLFEQQVS